MSNSAPRARVGLASVGINMPIEALLGRKVGLHAAKKGRNVVLHDEHFCKGKLGVEV